MSPPSRDKSRRARYVGLLLQETDAPDGRAGQRAVAFELGDLAGGLSPAAQLARSRRAGLGGNHRNPLHRGRPREIRRQPHPRRQAPWTEPPDPPRQAQPVQARSWLTANAPPRLRRIATKPAFGEATLSNCEREQIHLAGCIQPHGALLSVSETDQIILQCSANATEFLGLDRDPVGLALRDLGGDLWRRAQEIPGDPDLIPYVARCRLADGRAPSTPCCIGRPAARWWSN